MYYSTGLCALYTHMLAICTIVLVHVHYIDTHVCHMYYSTGLCGLYRHMLAICSTVLVYVHYIDTHACHMYYSTGLCVDYIDTCFPYVLQYWSMCII